MQREKIFFFLATLPLMITSCMSDKAERVPDVSHIEVDAPLRRFEQDFFALDTQNLAAGLQELEGRYPDFSDIYFGQILGSRDERIAPEGHVAYVSGFLKHPPVRQLYDTCMALYRDMDAIHADFRQSMRYFRYYFPEQPVPSLTTFISEYSIAAFIYEDNHLAVGLDFFLGADYPYRKYNPGNPNFSEYLVRTFNRDHLLRKAIRPLVDDLTGQPADNRLLDLMIHNGKKLYLADHLLPFAPDTVIIEMQPDQLQWMRDNELEMWAYFLSEDLLYSRDHQNIRKFVEYSPHSPGMPPEAPGRTANFLGWRIVKAYMRQHPETGIPALLNIKDAQQILDGSKYKPGR